MCTCVPRAVQPLNLVKKSHEEEETIKGELFCKCSLVVLLRVLVDKLVSSLGVWRVDSGPESRFFGVEVLGMTRQTRFPWRY